MKNKLMLTVASMLCLSFAAYSQTTSKIGFVDVDYILSQMPESKQVEADLKAHNKQLESQFQAKAQEYQTKLDAYQQTASTMIDAVRKAKEEELTRMQSEITKFQQSAQASLQKKQTELMQPLFDKVGDIIKKVADENSFTHILNRGMAGLDVVIYGKEEFDVSNLVLKKMGITPPTKQ